MLRTAQRALCAPDRRPRYVLRLPRDAWYRVRVVATAVIPPQSLANWQLLAIASLWQGGHGARVGVPMCCKRVLCTILRDARARVYASNACADAIGSDRCMSIGRVATRLRACTRARVVHSQMGTAGIQTIRGFTVPHPVHSWPQDACSHALYFVHGQLLRPPVPRAARNARAGRACTSSCGWSFAIARA